jgi:ribosomal protein L40E
VFEVADSLVVVVIAVAAVVLVVTAIQSRRHVARTDMRLCKECGTVHPTFAAFCRKCGQKLG